MQFENILKHLGTHGRWQITNYVVVCMLFHWPLTWHLFAVAFIAIEPDHHCQLQNCSKEQCLPNKTVDGQIRHAQCRRYHNETSNVTVTCSRWEYSQSEKLVTIVTEWDLVCDRQWWNPFSHSIFIIGAAVGGLLLTSLSDIYGRKPYFFATLWMMGIAGLCTAFSPSFVVFNVFQFIRGVFVQGPASTGLILASEIFPTKQRVIAGFWVQAFWSTGIMSTALLGYLVRNWRHFCLVMSLPIVLSVPFIWFVPESPRWLADKGETKKAKVILLKAAKVNRVTIPDDLFTSKTKGDSDTPVVEPASYICTIPRMRKHTIVMLYVWFAVNLAYWGLSLGTSDIVDNRYLSFFLNGLVELPATLFCLLVIGRWGRRGTVLFLCLLGGLCLMAHTLTPKQSGGRDIRWVRTLLALFGKFSASGAYLNLLFYSQEIFPTAHRNLGLGAGYVTGLIGGAAAPYFNQLGKYIHWLPGVVFSVACLLAGLVTPLLPETVGQPLPKNFREVDRRANIYHVDAGTLISERIINVHPDMGPHSKHAEPSLHSINDPTLLPPTKDISMISNGLFTKL